MGSTQSVPSISSAFADLVELDENLSWLSAPKQRVVAARQTPSIAAGGHKPRVSHPIRVPVATTEEVFPCVIRLGGNLLLERPTSMPIAQALQASLSRAGSIKSESPEMRDQLCSLSSHQVDHVVVPVPVQPKPDVQLQKSLNIVSSPSLVINFELATGTSDCSDEDTSLRLQHTAILLASAAVPEPQPIGKIAACLLLPAH